MRWTRQKHEGKGEEEMLLVFIDESELATRLQIFVVNFNASDRSWPVPLS